MGSLSNDDDDSNGSENGKKAIALDWQKTTLHVHHAFLYISLPSLYDCDVKMRPKFTCCGEREHKATTFFFFPLNLETVFEN